MIMKRGFAFLAIPFFVTYVARDLENVIVGKIICTLDETVISAGVMILFKKGNPLLDRFNIIMRCYLEAGLPEILWTELQHQASLRGEGRLREAVVDMFFAFPFSHLMPAFVY